MELVTERLKLRELTSTDAKFVFELLNTEAFKANIGDRNVNSLQDAKDKIENFYTAGYPKYGLFAVDLLSGETIGTVSYLKRDYLDYDDIGYAFLPDYWGQGFALEATKALMELRLSQGINCILGVVNSDNQASIRLLEKLGFNTIGMVLMEGEEEPILKMEYKNLNKK